MQGAIENQSPPRRGRRFVLRFAIQAVDDRL
jgi:hypothetical protein